jgi:2,3-bisphosphoglycerate-dependent phosphoglycerate mutase
MQLYFIRHAQSTNNRLWLQTGAAAGRELDPPLTDTGQQQARLLGVFLTHTSRFPGSTIYDPFNRAGFRLTHLYCSLMTRAVQTALIVAEVLDMPAVAWPEWHEGGGLYLTDETTGESVGQPGPSRAELEEKFPQLTLPDTVGETGWWNRPYETEAACRDRAREAVRALRERHGGTLDHVGIISHGAFYNYFMCELLQIPYGSRLWLGLANTALTRVDFHEQSLEVIYTNRADHLPAELIS